MKNYILDGKEIRIASSVDEWANFLSSADKVIQKTEVGDVEVSTVFLSADYGLGIGPPVLFETMVFGSNAPNMTQRYCTYAQAERGHWLMVERWKQITGAPM